MSVKFKYKNGFEGVVSDAVGAILEKKDEGKIVGASGAKPMTEAARGKLIDKIVKANLGTAEEVAKLSDEDLVKLAKEAK